MCWANFFVQLFESMMGLLVGLGGLAVVFNHAETLNGWTPEQLLALVGILILVGGLINIGISPSMQRFMEDVQKGTLARRHLPRLAAICLDFHRSNLLCLHGTG